MKRDEHEPLPWPQRLVDAPPEDHGVVEARAAELLELVAEPQPMTDVQLARIVANIASSRSVGPARPWLRWTAALAVASLALVVGAVFGQRARPSTDAAVAQQLVVPAGLTAEVHGAQGQVLLLSGPGRLRWNAAAASVRLEEGRLALSAASTGLEVTTPTGTVSVEAGSVVEIDVRSSHLTVASYQGRVRLGSVASSPTIELAAGNALRDGELTTLPSERTEALRRLLSVAPASTPIPTPATESPAPSPPVVVRAEAPSPPSAVAPPSAASRRTAIQRKPSAPSTVSEVASLEAAPVEAVAPRAPVALRAADPVELPAGIVDRPAPLPIARPVAAPVESALAAESHLLAEGLRREHAGDHKGALAVLDEHHRRFPSGRLSPEADRARVQALLGLERRKMALEVLDHMSEGELGASSNLRVLRGELRAESRHYADAKADFQLALRSAEGPLAERALYGSASSRSRLKDDAGALHDLEEYLRRFPEGRHAAEARRALAR